MATLAEDLVPDELWVLVEPLLPAAPRTSRRSRPQHNCVETAKLSGNEIGVRNSRDPAGPALIFSRAEIVAFLQGVKDGDFDDLVS